MIAMGQIQRPVLGYEASGIINRVGAKVTKFKQGDRVIYMGQGAMRTALRSHESYVHALPTNLTFEEGVTIPIAYATAYQSLIEVARLQKGESVLIHAAAGGEISVLGQDLFLSNPNRPCRFGPGSHSDFQTVKSRHLLYGG